MLKNVKMPTIVGILAFISMINLSKYHAHKNVKMSTIDGILTIISMINIMLINVKMPTIVAILTFISMINQNQRVLKFKIYYFSAY